MNDLFLDKLKQRNISEDFDKTKERVKQVWANSSKEERKALITFAGKSMYNALPKITKSGRITAKMTIIIARHLNANPFYLIGRSDENMSYTDDYLRDFLTHLGYRKVWNEYAKYIEQENKANEEVIIAPVETVELEEIILTEPETIDTEPIEEPCDCCSCVNDVLAETSDEPVEISKETLDIKNNLTEEETITLLQALMIRAKVPNSKSRQIADEIKLKLLIY